MARIYGVITGWSKNVARKRAHHEHMVEMVLERKFLNWEGKGSSKSYIRWDQSQRDVTCFCTN